MFLSGNSFYTGYPTICEDLAISSHHRIKCIICCFPCMQTRSKTCKLTLILSANIEMGGRYIARDFYRYILVNDCHFDMSPVNNTMLSVDLVHLWMNLSFLR